MKIVLHKDWGVFKLPKAYADYFNLDEYDSRETVRTEPSLIEYLEEHPDPELRVIEFSDQATDWTINNYDGNETLYYVVHGLIHKA